MSSNDTKNMLLNNNNYVILKNEFESYSSKNKSNGFNKNINGTSIFNPIIENAKGNDEYNLNQKDKNDYF